MSRSPTETLISAMDQFRDAEPKDCLVIWTDEKGDVCWSCSTDLMTTKLGMVEFVRTIFKKRIGDSD